MSPKLAVTSLHIRPEVTLNRLEGWAPADAKCTIIDKQVAPRLSLITALDTDGKIWCSLTQANTDGDVMVTFLQHLIKQLNREDAGW